MNTPSAACIGNDRPEDVPEIRTLTIFDNRASAVRADAILNGVNRGLAGEFCINNQQWALELLRFPALSDIAVQEAADVDVIVVSVEKDFHSGDDVAGWIMRLRPRNSARPGAVALVWDKHNEEQPPECSAALRAAARRVGMDFVSDFKG